MTNREKFKEVFGFEPEAYKDESICNFLICGNQNCETCRYCTSYEEDEWGKIYTHASWDDKYIGG